MQVLDTVDADRIRALHERGEFFWLDLQGPTDEQLDVLGELLGIPALAIQDTKEFGQRPKIDDYGARVLVVFYGADGDAPVEVHVHVSGDEVITVRRAPCAHLGAARERAIHDPSHTEQDVVYRVLEALSEALRELVDGHAGEVEHLDWHSPWVEPVAMRASRERLLAEAVPSQATVVFTHAPFPPWGRIVRAGAGYRFVAA
jgi:magnesium transporter